jgi:cytochrome c peroxidase
MNNILKISLTVFLFVIIYLSSLWSLPKPKIEYMDDKTLREYALSHGLAPTPTEYTQLLKVLDNPQNPMTKEKIELGKELFFDPILSLDESISCASCHILKEGGDDNLPTAIGYHGLANPKHLNSPTVLNAALAKA